MLNKLLFKLGGRLPCRLISLDSGPYLERYYLGQVFGVTFYLHRFVSADSERHIHNHPWAWGAALILAGEYWEERATDLCPQAGPSGCIVKTVHRRWFNRVDGNTFHRIRDAQPGTWTLFFHGKRPEGKGWGFIEQAVQPAQTVTVFRLYPGADFRLSREVNGARWWHHAPKGNDSERAPL